MASPLRGSKHRKCPSFSTSPPIEKFIKESASKNINENDERIVWTDRSFKTHVNGYKLMKRLGKGSGGEVFLGRHSETRQEVAIKIVRKSSRHPQAERMVRQEYRVMQYLQDQEVNSRKNNHLVQHVATLENEREIAIVMQYAKGGDLFELVNRRGALPETEAWRIFHQLVHAVSYAHGKNICHRDIKPCNVFLDKKCNVVLGDWGHARSWNSFDNTSENCGSLCYSAPEVLQGDTNYTGPEIDLWSCGTVLYVMLSGKRPFWAKDTADLRKNIRLGQYESLPSNVSEQASNLLSILLSPDPLRRATIMDVMNHPWMKEPPARHKRALSLPCIPLPKQAPHPALVARRELVTYRTTMELSKWREQKTLVHVPEKNEVNDYFRSYTVPNAISAPSSPNHIAFSQIRATSGGELIDRAHSIGGSGDSGLSDDSDFDTAANRIMSGIIRTDYSNGNSPIASPSTGSVSSFLTSSSLSSSSLFNSATSSTITTDTTTASSANTQAGEARVRVLLTPTKKKNGTLNGSSSQPGQHPKLSSKQLPIPAILVSDSESDSNNNSNHLATTTTESNSPSVSSRSSQMRRDTCVF